MLGVHANKSHHPQDPEGEHLVGHQIHSLHSLGRRANEFNSAVFVVCIRSTRSSSEESAAPGATMLANKNLAD